MPNPPQHKDDSAPTLPTIDQPAHISLNLTAKETIVLLHGGFSSPTEFHHITPFLQQDYHILIPSLPGHAGTRALRPFTLDAAAALVADLIRREAKGGRAHVAGISLGGLVALHTAAKYPDVIHDRAILASGVHVFREMNALFLWLLPYCVALQMTLLRLLPASAFNWLIRTMLSPTSPLPPARFRDEFLGCDGYGLATEFRASIVEEQFIGPVGARTLVVAARDEGAWFTQGDRVEDVRKIGGAARRGNEASRVVKVEGCKHAWGVQRPEVFAEVVRWWVEEGEEGGRPAKVADL